MKKLLLISLFALAFTSNISASADQELSSKKPTVEEQRLHEEKEAKQAIADLEFQATIIQQFLATNFTTQIMLQQEAARAQQALVEVAEALQIRQSEEAARAARNEQRLQEEAAKAQQGTLNQSYLRAVVDGPVPLSRSRRVTEQSIEQWECNACTFLNTNNISVCEMCEGRREHDGPLLLVSSFC